VIWEVIAGVAVVALAALPPKYGPAVRLKEWLQKDKDS